MAKRQKKTTHFEYGQLVAFVENNEVLLQGKPKPTEAQKIKNLWKIFADKMTALAVGPIKSPDRWRKIFVEWKVNVKRKSRLINKEVTGTGSGPRITKPLSELEERLFNLIRVPNLGDSRLPDRLGHADFLESVHEVVDDIDIKPQLIDLPYHTTPLEFVTENEDEINMSPADQNSDEDFLIHTPYTVEEIPSKTSQGEQSSVPEQYPTLILQEACNSFKNANSTNVTSNEILAEALNKFTEVFKVKAEADMLRAKAEMAKAKCLHFQTFGNLDDFKF